MINKLLKNLDACNEAQAWASNKSWNEIYATCERGDWLLWLFVRTNPNDLEYLTLAKAHCANTVRHLLTDERSINAIDIAIAFGNGKATMEELNIAYAAASAAASSASAATYASSASAASASAATYASSAYASSASAATYASSASAYAAASAAASADAAAAYASSAARSAAYGAQIKNQMLTANICREILPIEIWAIKED